MNTMSMQTEIFDLPSSEVNQEGVESSFNGVRNITTHKVISNETVQNDGKILRAASIYSEPVDNTGLSVYADGYYSLGGWAITIILRHMQICIGHIQLLQMVKLDIGNGVRARPFSAIFGIRFQLLEDQLQP